MIYHPWHEVSIGRNPPSVVNAVVEIPKGSRAKYEIDKESGLIKLDRVLYSTRSYPTHYGIIPQTLYDDGDPLDILVLTQVTLVPLTLISVKVIGLMRMIDQDIVDDKIIAIAEKDPSVNYMNDIEDLTDFQKLELKDFFENYTVLEGKKVTIEGFFDKNFAFTQIERAIELYKVR